MKRNKNRILSLVLCATVLLSSSMPMTLASAKEESRAVAVEMNAQGYASEIISNVRVQVLSPTVVRLEEKGPKGFEDRTTFHIPSRDQWEGTEVTRKEENGTVILSTSVFDIIVPADAEDLSGITISDKEGRLIWKYKGLPGSKVYLPDPGENVMSWELGDNPRMTVPEWGFTPQPDENIENRDTNGFDQSNDAPDMYVFLPQGSSTQVRKDFVKLTGQTEMLPLSTFGAWDSRYYQYDDAEAMQQIADYHETYQVPLDNLVIDTDWRSAGTGGIGYDINTDLFPDMKDFLKRAHEKNVDIIFNDHPEPTKDNGKQNSAIIPQEIQYRYDNLTRLLDMGLDAWWYDRNWSTTIVPPEGFTHETIGAALYADAQKAVYPDRRLFMMSNIDGTSNGAEICAPNVGQHRYAVTWTGDTGGHQETLYNELEFAVKYGALGGLPYVSVDVGTHQTSSNAMSADEYVKWMQYGTLSPIYRPHCSWVGDVEEGRMPWVKGEEALNIIRDYVNMRYRLLPTFYNLSHETYETGMPLVRRLDFYYPEYASAARNDQYLLGDDILIAPTITDSNNGDPAVPAEWLKTPDGQKGLKAEYFNNYSLNGEPVLTQTVPNIDYDWGTGSPVNGINSDNFSIRYTGTITIGDKDVKLQTCSDDGARIYINDELFVDSWKDQSTTVKTSDGVLKAGETYNVRYEYYEKTDKAICKMQYVVDDEQEETICTRTVWIPEGEWIDLFNGETVYGPRSIEVEAPISETPMYIKKGAILPLADEMMTTKEKDWSHMTLDVYPSTRNSDTTTLYEDDTISNDYTEGKFRTTELSTKFEDGKTVIDIGVAKGTFDGDRCFDNRDWTVRIHQPEGWGDLQSVTTADGQTLNFTAVAQDTSAMPFEIDGGANDGTVYEVEVSGNVYEAMKLIATFDNAVDPEIPNLDYDKAVVYDSYKLPVERTIDVSSEMPYVVDLSSLGNLDWIQTNVSDARQTIRKDSTVPQITFLKQNARSMGGFNDYCTSFSYSDGTPIQTVNETRNGSVIFDTDASFEFNVKATEEEKQLILFIGGWKSNAKLEIFDKSADTVIDTYTFGDESKSYYRKVTIDMTSETGTELVVRYTKTSGSNITFAAAALRDPNADPGDDVNKAVERTVDVTDKYPEKRNLTEEGNLDWIHLGRAATSDINRKAVDEEQLVLTTSSTLVGFNDHRTAFSWSDGTPDKEATDLITGLQQSKVGSDFTVKAKAGPEEKILTLYLGGWKGRGRLTVYDASGLTENQSYEFGNLDTNFYTTVTINLKAKEESTLYVRYELIEANGGNVSFVAATLNQPAVEPAEHMLTVNFPKNVKMSIDGEEQKLANLIGSYKNVVMADTAMAFSFAPAIEGREIAGVTVNGEAVAIGEDFNVNEYILKTVMPNENTEINLDFTVVNKQVLRSTIAVAEDCADEAALAVDSVQKKYEAALKAAKAAEANKAATQAEINDAWSELIDALHYLSFVAGDKTKLEAPMQLAEMIDRDMYTPNSLAVLDKAYADAADLMDDADVLEADIQAAVDALYKALNDLVERADTTQLEGAIANGEAIDQSKYFDDDAMKTFREVLASAKALLEDANATQAAVIEKVDELIAAMMDLRVIPNKDALKDLVAEGESTSTTNVPAAVVNQLAQAMSQAKAVLADENATEDDVKTAVAAMQTALKAVEDAKNNNKPDPKPDTKPSKKSSNSTRNTSNAYGTAGIVSASQSAAASVRSDTNGVITLNRGSVYTFKMTVVNGSGLVPSFTVGNGSVLKTQFVSRIGNDFYYKVYAVGTPGESTGVYTTLNGQSAQMHCTVKVA
ncbi:TIM-barrel domain-containing protein [Anaeromassilibacillus senegalensis]|uniref:TIM-barrel domain-containing protein n=1 Tax=Anaeromassilibacillus senegalensis TaxID=1673717 RepID=UPI0006836244|nr:TIM-barrel domain-containing protein [Anaeromassilibacillus senegalensis]